VQLSRAGNFTCAKCHLEKEGPFVFPHVAAEAEGCATCHEPHGSVTPHLLVRADISLVCYQCHQAPFGLAPPSFHREDARGVCTECHVQIHGSNLDPKFMR
jgi:predicted CXXCH cytochrome family protein